MKIEEQKHVTQVSKRFIQINSFRHSFSSNLKERDTLRRQLDTLQRQLLDKYFFFNFNKKKKKTL